MQQRLQQRIHAARKADGGFTLIELLIVIVILGILAGVVVFSVQAIQDRGTSAACKTNLKTVESAVAASYADNNNTWPTPTSGNLAQTLFDDTHHYIKEVPTVWTYNYVGGTGNNAHDVVSTPGC